MSAGTRQPARLIASTPSEVSAHRRSAPSDEIATLACGRGSDLDISSGPHAPGVKPGNELQRARDRIIACNACPRLRDYCTRIAREKKAAHRDEIYWGRPVPGFGDPRARLFVLGLAPAAHGANRTGRGFTGDGSGDFLMQAMYDTGFASLPASRRADDGLRLIDAWIAAAVRCAPPDNKPTPGEIRTCQTHLDAEWDALPEVRVVVALGRIAFDAALARFQRVGSPVRPKPAFAHGAVYAHERAPALVASYHPSRQNTNTGKLTPAMMRDVFARARQLIEGR